MIRAAAIILILLMLAVPVAATGWQGFYTPSERAGYAGMAIDDDAVCVREILKAQLRYGIPNNILLGIGLQEAGIRREGSLTVWPWSVNAEGEGRIFASREAANDWVQQRRAEGVQSIDVGCLQVNLHWHPEAFSHALEGFDPAVNVDYAARFLKSLYRKTGDWEIAAGSYHSFTPERREIYLSSLRQNVMVANGRLEEFRVLAGQARPRGEQQLERPDLPTGMVWSSGLSRSQQGENGARSIYSQHDMQPLLPQFLQGPD
ncbi:hypothetical protein [Phaeobacter sp. 22II1-1F12B]|uniref:hypothetical protein n=1 Tax=Phaeobacter sp. 22II1-1F12B TaxID=1317111 RepID=UPI000B5258FF|nr:hypothetical protein [Phaeobacter sp. 22II1-1F12B]OWU78148.1 hypothetical protein ATO1_14200 [Phaeobacter sp. 22II1-1F12B]